MLMCDLQLLPCQEEPRPSRRHADTAQLQRRTAERLLALARRVELGATAAIGGRAAKRLCLLEIDAVLAQLHRSRSDVATRLLILAHAGRARSAYTQAYGGSK